MCCFTSFKLFQQPINRIIEWGINIIECNVLLYLIILVVGSFLRFLFRCIQIFFVTLLDYSVLEMKLRRKTAKNY